MCRKPSPTHTPTLHDIPNPQPLVPLTAQCPHAGEKPYVCTVPGCGKRFTEYSSLYKHHVVHTHCKPYTCSTCGKTYRQTSTLAMHQRSAHGELETTEESEQAMYEQQQLGGEQGRAGEAGRDGGRQSSSWNNLPHSHCSRGGRPTAQAAPHCLPLGGERRGR